MAAKTLYIKDAAASGSSHGSLQDGGSAPATATTGTGWTVSKVASGNWSLMVYGSERAAATFGATPQPASAPTTTDCWRTESKITGKFAAAAWSYTVSVIAVTSGGDQDGSIRVRFWKTTSPTGASAVEIGSVQTGTAVTNLTTTTAQSSTGSFSPGAVELVEEYVFWQMAWEVTGAGGANGRDVLIRTDGTNSKITTADFTPGMSAGIHTVGALPRIVLAPVRVVSMGSRRGGTPLS